MSTVNTENGAHVYGSLEHVVASAAVCALRNRAYSALESGAMSFTAFDNTHLCFQEQLVRGVPKSLQATAVHDFVRDRVMERKDVVMVVQEAKDCSLGYRLEFVRMNVHELGSSVTATAFHVMFRIVVAAHPSFGIEPPPSPHGA